MKRQQDFFRSATILAFAGFITKLIGALYRIPLTNIIGPESIGMYQLVFSVYALFLTSSTGGLPAGLSKLIAETKATGGGSEEIGRVTGSSLGLVGLTSLLFTAVLAVFSRQIAAIQGNSAVAAGYIAVAPAIFFVGIVSVLRGWFQGQLDMTPTALSQIVEQVIKLSVGLTLSAVLIKKGILHGAVGAILGVVVSELLAAVYLYVLFLKRGGQLTVAANLKDMKADFKRVARYSVPITIGGVLLPLTQFTDSFLVVNLLKGAGFGLNVSTSLYGILTGPVNSLINLPVVITLSLAVVIIPVVSRSKSRRNIREILEKSNFATKTALFIGVPAAVLFMVFSGEIIRILYPGFNSYETDSAAGLLGFSAIGIVFLALMQIFTALLQALDRPFIPIRNLGLAMVIKVSLNILLIPRIGIAGASLASVAAYFFAAALNFASLSRLIGFNRGLIFAAIKALFAGGIAAILVLLLKNAVPNLYLSFLTAAISAVIVYLLLIIWIKFFTDDELSGLPFGKIALKLKK